MSERKEVTCVNRAARHNVHHRIASIGGEGWEYSEREAIHYIREGLCEFYIVVDGREVPLVIETRHGRDHLKTENDVAVPESLLGFPGCY